MKKYGVLVLLAIAGLLFWVINLFLREQNSSDDLEVTRINKERKAQNVPIIENDWIKESGVHRNYKWSNNIRGINSPKPHHLYKEIKETDTSYQERDAFHFEYSELAQYRLIIIHNYDSARNKYVREKNELIIYEPKKFPPSHGVVLSLESTDSVLRIWKMK